MQTDDPRRVTVFCSIDGTMPDGSVIDGPWESIDIELTDKEAMIAAALKDRAKLALAERKNAAAADAARITKESK